MVVGVWLGCLPEFVVGLRSSCVWLGYLVGGLTYWLVVS